MTALGRICTLFGVLSPVAASCAAVSCACAKEAPRPAPSAAAPSASVPAPKPPGATRIVSYPNGEGLVVDTDSCTVALVGADSERRWQKTLPHCGGVLEAAIAPNSYSYVRTASTLVALSHHGNEKWRVEVPEVPAELVSPAATLDSMVAAAASRRSLVAFKPDGKKAWKFDIEGGEQLISAPTGSKAEGVIAVTTAAVYAIAPDGSLRWRRVLPFSPQPR